MLILNEFAIQNMGIITELYIWDQLHFSLILTLRRGARWQGIAQDVTIRDDMRYSLTAYIKFLSLAPGTLYDAVQLVMQCLDNTNNGKINIVLNIRKLKNNRN